MESIRSIIGYLLVLYAWQIPLLAFDTAHFYRATPFLPFLYEPRLARSWLNSFDGIILAGSNAHAQNGDGKPVCLLSVYGPAQFMQLGAPIDTLKQSEPFDRLLAQLTTRSACQQTGIGFLDLSAKSKILETHLAYTQNFSHGVFFQVHIPIHTIELTRVQYDIPFIEDWHYHDDTPTLWRTFAQHFLPIMKHWGLSVDGYRKTGLGDITLALGVTRNNDETSYFDFIDATAKVGILLPTGRSVHVDQVFDIALGYNGHTGVVIAGSAALGMFEWLSFGIYGQLLLLAHREQMLRIKTHPCQSGFIHLACESVRIKPGLVAQLTIYVKADHVLRGLSTLFGYSFALQRDSHVKRRDSHARACCIGDDERFKQWRSHTLHAMAEYDFATDPLRPSATLGFYCNITVTGKRIFNTNTGGMGGGIKIGWQW